MVLTMTSSLSFLLLSWTPWALARRIMARTFSGISHFMCSSRVKWERILSMAGLGSDPLGITVSIAALNSIKAVKRPGDPYFSFRVVQREAGSSYSEYWAPIVKWRRRRIFPNAFSSSSCQESISSWVAVILSSDVASLLRTGTVAPGLTHFHWP